MGTPAEYLPRPISEAVINALLVDNGFPEAISIASAKVTAEYYAIYRITVPPNTRSAHTDLILRVSGHHLPRIKTENEVGVMSWVSRNTSIPIPDLVAWDASTDNPLTYEYTLLSRVQGDTLSDIYRSLDESQIRSIRTAGMRLAALKLTERGDIAVAQVMDESFWQHPDVEKYWPADETITSLNIKGPYPSYVDYISAQIRKCIQLIQIHESLEFMPDLIPRLEAFVRILPQHSAELNNVKLRLAYKDMHLVNMLYDASSGKITAILDWEFSGIVPFTRWNLRRAFLWNGQHEEESAGEKRRLWDLFAARCKARGVAILDDAMFASPLQESMQQVATFLCAITEVAPRGQRIHLVPQWTATILENLTRFEAFDHGGVSTHIDGPL